MSLEMHTYVPFVDDSLIPQWMARMQELGMNCAIHPEFSFESHTGFLPFKLQLQDSGHSELNGVDFVTGFEYYMDDFNLESELEGLTPARSLIGRLFGKSKTSEPFVTRDIDAKLSKCRKRLTFVWSSGDLFELRMATVSAAILAELTDGISSYPADGTWYESPTAAADAVAEAKAYEDSLNSRDIKVHRFEQWL